MVRVLIRRSAFFPDMFSLYASILFEAENFSKSSTQDAGFPCGNTEKNSPIFFLSSNDTLLNEYLKVCFEGFLMFPGRSKGNIGKKRVKPRFGLPVNKAVKDLRYLTKVLLRKVNKIFIDILCPINYCLLLMPYLMCCYLFVAINIKCIPV